MPLQHDYRPKSLYEIIGNRETVSSLRALLARKDNMLPHCFLFVGPKGCGKTTMARITAAMLTIQDFNEQNSASYRGIDSARELITQARLRPLVGDRKAWLLDECHKLTADAQEALLKLVEEPPTHVFLFFATTDPQKMKKTLVDRCHVFKVESLSRRQVEELVKSVLAKEKVELPVDVINSICDNCDGSARNALVLLDSVIDMDAKEALAVVQRMSAELSESIELCRALIKSEKWTRVAAIIKNMGEYDPENVRQAVMGYCQAILLKEDSPRAWVVLDAFREPFDRSGRPGVVWAAYMATGGK